LTLGAQPASGGREWADEGAGSNRHGFSLRDFGSKKVRDSVLLSLGGWMAKPLSSWPWEWAEPSSGPSPSQQTPASPWR
jgi:hypothetical protein